MSRKRKSLRIFLPIACLLTAIFVGMELWAWIWKIPFASEEAKGIVIAIMPLGIVGIVFVWVGFGLSYIAEEIEAKGD